MMGTLVYKELTSLVCKDREEHLADLTFRLRTGILDITWQCLNVAERWAELSFSPCLSHLEVKNDSIDSMSHWVK